ncbi:hypothetical protein WN55_11195 [Dufourea novaeangliae]|uniref:Ig-like domain-containing protein n=1 Tax=Dufourea novaeangliae TaxID=178035 RepID=A0A154PC82_DUFNO|nr:hypothetical protein WN55_11195 [Dufourea novaeangliae]
MLRCHYDLEEAPLYSLKWYRGRHEFYRFTPSEDPATKIFNITGIHVDVANSNKSQVTLRDVDFGLSGTFSCEVTADAPTFSTASVSKNLTVVSLPEGTPIIVSERERYDPGDTLRANCSLPPSKPPAHLSFTLNNVAVDSYTKHQPQQYPPPKWDHNDAATHGDQQENLQWIEIRVNLQPFYYSNGQLNLRCSAQIPGIYSAISEVQLGAGLREPVPERGVCNDVTPLDESIKKSYHTDVTQCCSEHLMRHRGSREQLEVRNDIFQMDLKRDLRKRKRGFYGRLSDDADAVHAPATSEIVIARLRPRKGSSWASHDKQQQQQQQHTSQKQKDGRREGGMGRQKGQTGYKYKLKARVAEEWHDEETRQEERRRETEWRKGYRANFHGYVWLTSNGGGGRLPQTLWVDASEEIGCRRRSQQEAKPRKTQKSGQTESERSETENRDLMRLRRQHSHRSCRGFPRSSSLSHGVYLRERKGSDLSFIRLAGRHDSGAIRLLVIFQRCQEPCLTQLSIKSFSHSYTSIYHGHQGTYLVSRIMSTELCPKVFWSNDAEDDVRSLEGGQRSDQGSFG